MYIDCIVEDEMDWKQKAKDWYHKVARGVMSYVAPVLMVLPNVGAARSNPGADKDETILKHSKLEASVGKVRVATPEALTPLVYNPETYQDIGCLDIDKVADEGVTAHLHAFLAREFGNTAASYLLPMMQEHYRLAHIRKPEFMGNTRTEEKDPKYKVVCDLPWSEPFIRIRLAEYQRLENQAAAWGMRMPEAKRQAYYQLVQYPLQGAAEMNKKCLYAQLARHGKADWKQSEAAFDSIVSLTKTYNTPKWQGIMDYKPRNLAVYQPIPQTKAAEPLKAERPCLYKWNALEATKGDLQVYEGLGYEGMAAGIPEGKTATFHLDNCRKDSVEVELRFLPTHPVNGKDLRVQVSLNGQETPPISYRTYGRSEEWKVNILTNQAVRRMKFAISPNRPNTLTIKALDEGVVLDQVYVY